MFSHLLVSFLAIAPAQAQTATSENVAAPAPTVQTWADRVTVNGDFRLRTDHQDTEGKDSRIRSRVRARLGVTGKVNEQVDATIRLATGQTGSENIVSTNQTLDGASDKKPFWLDLAHLTWKPGKKTTVQAGKVPNPFFTPGKSQLVWDSDLTLEGAQVRYVCEGETNRFFANVGGYWLDENFSNTSAQSPNDALTGGVQIGADFKGSVSSAVAVSFYHHGLKGVPVLVGTDGAAVNTRGNSTTGGNYTNNYDLLNAGAEVGIDVGRPLAIYADYVVNTAISNKNDGYLAGLRLGKLKDRGSWALDYNYRATKADGTFGLFSDSDFSTGGTNNRGHVIAAQYQIAEGTSTSLTYFMTEANVDATPLDAKRAMLDFVFVF